MKIIEDVDFITKEQIAVAYDIGEFTKETDDYFEYLLVCSGITSESERKAFFQGYYACCDIMTMHLKKYRLGKVNTNG